MHQHTVHITEVINAPIEKVWKIIRNFNGLSYFHPAIKDSKIEHGDPEEVGCVRYLTLETGFVREELLMLDDNTYAFDYSILESTLPLLDYVASVRLRPNSNEEKTICEWWADFEVPDGINKSEMIDLVGQHVFKAGLLALGTKISKQMAYN